MNAQSVINKSEQFGVNMERHAPTLVMLILAGVMTWVGVTVKDTEVQVALHGQMLSTNAAATTELKDIVDKLEDKIDQATSDRYTGTEARRDSSIPVSMIGISWRTSARKRPITSA